MLSSTVPLRALVSGSLYRGLVVVVIVDLVVDTSSARLTYALLYMQFWL